MTQAGGTPPAYPTESRISQVYYTLKEELEFDPGELNLPPQKKTLDISPSIVVQSVPAISDQ